MTNLYNINIDDRIPLEANRAMDLILDGDPLLDGLNSSDNGLHVALLALGKRVGFDLKMPEELIGTLDRNLRKISFLSGFRYQKVMLHDLNWWKKDNGPLLVMHRESQQYYALLPLASGGYRTHHTVPQNINQQNADQFDLVAYVFFLPFPDRIIKLLDVLKLSLGTSRSELGSILLSQIILGIIGLLTPILFGSIVDSAIPLSDKNMLGQIMFGLIAATMCGFILMVLQSIAFLRLKLKSTSFVESALWERLLRIPLSFFRQYGIGELMNRIKGLDSIYLSINANFLKTLFNGIWSILSIIFIFFYDSSVAWIILSITFVMCVFLVTTSLVQLYFNKKIFFIEGRSFNLLLQIISGIKKIRTTHTERTFFIRWLDLLTAQLRYFMKANVLMIIANAMGSFIMIINTVIIYNHFISLGTEVSLGAFITVNALMGTFMASFLGFTSSLLSYIQLIPQYDRVKPILEALPESRDHDNISYPYGEIKNIQLKNISFSYEQSLLPTIINVDMSLRQGQFVAVVGGSGSGKSTLVRLLLGLEIPQEGKILYDGIDINQVPLQWVRSQCGVVLQSTNLMSGTLFDNITGFDNNMTEDEVHEAIRLANLTADIEALPMGLQTLVMDQGVGFSLGQRQRILIARALCHRPQILILDEATSALDSLNQKIIHENLAHLNLTRLVIAHRLSTIQQADIIYVMDKGAIVESGSYEELMVLGGHFAEMVK